MSQRDSFKRLICWFMTDGEPCASRGARTVREGVPTRCLPHDTYNTGESRGRETSHSLNYQKLGKELMSVDELAVMDGSKCILQLRGVRPFLSDKYDITKHPNYKYLSDADSRNTFDIEKFLAHRLRLKAEDEYAAFEINLEDEDEADEPSDEQQRTAADYGSLL